MYSSSIQIFIKIQIKPESAKLKINLNNTTIKQNRIQEIIKINDKLGENGEKMPTLEQDRTVQFLESINQCYENENESCGQPSYLAKSDLSLFQLFLISERERERRDTGFAFAMTVGCEGLRLER